MVSPHLLRVVESYSTSHPSHRKVSAAKGAVQDIWGDRPIFVIESKTKEPKWCHIVLAKGPALNEDSKESELVIIWWSEMGPDTERVLSAIDWEKHAKNV